MCKLQYDKFSILFTGDIEKEAESQIINSKHSIESTILKLAHHGSKTSSTEEFLQRVKPQVALVGVGENNNFGHPNQEIVDRINENNIQLYRTDKMGEIEITVNKKGEIKIKTFCDE